MTGNRCEVIVHLSSTGELQKWDAWIKEYDDSFLKHTLDYLGSAFTDILSYIEKLNPDSGTKINKKLIINLDPAYEAVYDKRQIQELNSNSEVNLYSSGEINLNMGVPIALSCLRPTFSYVGNSIFSKERHEAPTEILVNLAKFEEAWHFDIFPPSFYPPEENNLDYQATLHFLLAHEFSHFAFASDVNLKNRMYAFSSQILNDLVGDTDLLNDPQRQQLDRLFINETTYERWLEEISADIMGYEVCLETFKTKIIRGKCAVGLTTVCAIQAVVEHFMDLEEQEWPTSHPYSLVRLLAFGKYLHKQSGLPKDKFMNSLAWYSLTYFYFEIVKILGRLGKSYYPEEM